MLFNLDKCKVMHIGRNHNYVYTMGGQPLKKTESEKDIGVYISNNLKPSLQVAEAAKKANQVLGQLLRSVTYRDKVHFVKLYKQRVRCHLEFAIQTWNPWLQHDINLLENVQKRAVRCISGLTGTYEEKISQIGLTTLSERRSRGDMIQTYKIMNGIDDVDRSTWFNLRNDNQTQLTRQSTYINNDGSCNYSLNVVEPRSRLDVRKHFFSHRVTRQWNNLSIDIQKASSVNEFKNLYDNWYHHK